MSVSLLHPTRPMTCPGCGMGVDPERWVKRPYCLDQACIDEHATPLVLRSIGVHKSVPSFLLADDQRGKELVGAGRRRA